MSEESKLWNSKGPEPSQPELAILFARLVAIGHERLKGKCPHWCPNRVWDKWVGTHWSPERVWDKENENSFNPFATQSLRVATPWTNNWESKWGRFQHSIKQPTQPTQPTHTS